MALRILIGAGNYPKLSESYIEAEIRYFLRRGLEVAVWSEKVGSPEAPDLVKVFRNTLSDAIAVWKPTVFHAHYLTFAGYAFDQAARAGVPCTVRGHSFDQGIERARALARHPAVRRIWAFPHFARQINDPKVLPLPVAYDSSLYVPSKDKDRNLVYRTAAGKPGKGLEDFIELAALCPVFRFELTANNVLGDEPYLPSIEKAAIAKGVGFAKNILREEAVHRMARAGIYLDTSDPRSHPFGMPISIAEAMATGAYVLVREAEGAADYLGNAGAMYRNLSEAQGLILGTRIWTEAMWQDTAARAIAQARKYADDEVLKQEVSFWEELAS